MLQKVVFFAVLYCVTSSKNPDEVLSLPGLNFPLNYRHYSGYLNATEGKFLFYWFVESQSSPDTDPLLLWLNGGPGCSSLSGFLEELGPLHVLHDGKTLYNNTFSWNREANVLFLESPAGVGFSYSLDKKYSTNDDNVSYDAYLALQHFFKKFPQFKKNEFYITGESYGGVYVPTLSVRVLNGPAKINFKGFAIGNGMLDFDLNYHSLVYFAYYHGVIGTGMWKHLEKRCCTQMSCNFTFSNNFFCSMSLLQTILTVLDSGLNAYNLYADCAPSTSKNYRYLPDKKNLFGFSPIFLKANKLGKGVPCLDSARIHYYLNQPAVRKALHVPSFVQKWEMCSETVSDGYKRIYHTVKPQILQLINSGKLRGLIYYGDVDMICNFLGGEWFCEDLGLKGKSYSEQWKYGNQIAGTVKYYNKLTFVTIKGSGHMVPEDKPGPAFKMITSFLKNKEL